MDARQPGPVADSLDRRIISALQIDGRASWHRIATALGEAERTVVRRGTRLLDSGLVRIGAMALHGRSTVVGVRCAPGQARVAASALARRSDCVFTHVLTGSPDCVAELLCPREQLPSLVMDELPGLPGMVETFTLPVLRHIRTIREWHSGLLTDDEIAALARLRPSDHSASPSPPSSGDVPSSSAEDVLPPADMAHGISRPDRLLLNALAEDGRCTYEELGRVAGVSEATARRRLGALRREGRVRIRAVIEPALLGLPVEAMLWVRAAPAKAEAVAAALADSVHVRYASFVTGERQILVLAALPSESALYDFVTRGPWLRDVASVDTSLVIGSLKRGGMLARRARD
ncbi:Lrp/AsnC family transcriptional regulator [Streptomyces sporangiiformans]|uniref:Lrp/AsnC family transcriptional regulator n=1 Tax=Streptomyces sporangiiformans TaxID=2315329 RepID=A0A505DKM1_9ACTN|nr:Lrp/AsnC family transcriptional regulator [Streptomyces sporangiiformans]TPQ22108.1 Lrp/AsnC family transcriptional regulator [Streptomyces sporangiiformans]